MSCNIQIYKRLSDHFLLFPNKKSLLTSSFSGLTMSLCVNNFLKMSCLRYTSDNFSPKAQIYITWNIDIQI